MFLWLKQWMPRSLYGRAALILLLPVVTVQLVVSVAFIQRHYEGVTQQMTRTMVLQLAYLAAEVRGAPDAAVADARANQIGAALDLTVALPAGPVPDDAGPVFYDLSADTLTWTLETGLPQIGPITFDRLRSVTVRLPGPQGDMAVTFDRKRVSASNPHQLLVLMVVFGGLMTVIAYQFLRNQLRPIARLANAATEYGKGRNIPYQPSGATEVRAAGTAFLDMRQRIERRAQVMADT
jgi:two-component system, OmpR family, osmolarity sensor histidine kinase EnvZ